MKRDMTVVRQVLQAIAARESTHDFVPIDIEGVEPRVVSYHIKILVDGGYVDAEELMAMGDDFPSFLTATLTWAGNDLLDAIDSPKAWAAVRAKLGDQGLSAPVEIIKELATQFIRTQVGM